MAAKTTIDPQQATRIKALARRGRDKFRSLFVVLGDVQTQVGYRMLSNWCFQNIGTALPELLDLRKFLSLSERNGIKTEFTQALEFEPSERIATALDNDVKAKMAAMFKARAETGAKTMAGAERIFARRAAQAEAGKPKAADAARERDRRRIVELEAALAAARKAAPDRARKSTATPGSAGRPLAATEAQAAKVLELHKAKVSLRVIAERTGLGVRTIRTILARR